MKNIEKLKFKNIVLSSQHMTPQREPALSVGQLGILHVKSMFGKYRRGVHHQPRSQALPSGNEVGSPHACISSFVCTFTCR